MGGGEVGEGSGGGEFFEFVFVELGDAAGEVVNVAVRLARQRSDCRFRRGGRGCSGGRGEEQETRLVSRIVLYSAVLFGDVDVDRQDAEAMALGILDENRGTVEAHRLVVQNRAEERREIVALKIRAGIGQ